MVNSDQFLNKYPSYCIIIFFSSLATALISSTISLESCIISSIVIFVDYICLYDLLFILKPIRLIKIDV